MLPIYLYIKNRSLFLEYQTALQNILLMEDYPAYLALSTDSPDTFSLLLEKLSVSRPEHEGLYILEDDLTTACRIRSLDPRGYLVLISNNPQTISCALQLKIEVLDILSNQGSILPAKQLHACMEEAIRRSTSFHQQSLFHFTMQNQMTQVPCSEILYITAREHRLTLISLYRTYEFNGSLSDCIHQLDHRFLLCHRAFLINTCQIRSIDKQALTVTFCTGDTCITSIRGMRRLVKYIENTKYR